MESVLTSTELDEESSGGGVLRSFVPRTRRGVKDLVYRLEPEKPEPAKFYAVDAGCRTLDSTKIVVVVYGAAVAYVDGFVASGTYPYTGSEPYLDVGGAPIVAYGPQLGLDLPDFVAERPLVDPQAFEKALGLEGKSRISSLGYGSGFDRETMKDENRILLETAALEWSLENSGPSWYVLLDGPLFSTPGLYVSVSKSLRTPSAALKSYYATSYLYNALLRAWVLVKFNGFERVAGVVKRVHSSRLLSRASGREEERDVELVAALAEEMGVGPGTALAVGPIFTVLDALELFKCVLSAGGADRPLTSFMGGPLTRLGHGLSDVGDLAKKVGNLLIKRSYYLYVKGVDSRAAVVRVELPHPPYEGRSPDMARTGFSLDLEEVRKHVESDLELLKWISWFMLFPYTSPQPLPIALADKASRRLSRFLALSCFHELSGRTVFSYETLAYLVGEEQW